MGRGRWHLGGVGGLNVCVSLPCRRQKHEKGFTVCCLAWHPSGRQLAYTDTEGRLGLLDGLATDSTTDSAKVGTTWASKRRKHFGWVSVQGVQLPSAGRSFEDPVDGG